jgi:hypothetical protein
MTLQNPVFGRLEKVALREGWQNEAANFTPWLAKEENLKLLGETIGLELDLDSTEKNVGLYRADILCKEELSGNWVLIENQLERTNHSHLGQILTYAAGLSAVTIVWIAERFTDEHRAALDWLNEVTSEDINFFGLEIELWRIGNSSVAPKFNVVSQPNDWTKRISIDRQQVAELTEYDQLKLDFWTTLQQYLIEQGSTVSPQKPSTRYWTNVALGRANFRLVAVVGMRDGYIGVHVVLEGPFAQAHYNLLMQDRVAIESEIGETLSWRGLLENKAKRIELNQHGVDPTEKSQWPQLHSWLKSKLEVFHRAFAQRIKSLNITDYLPSVGEDDDYEPLQ